MHIIFQLLTDSLTNIRNFLIEVELSFPTVYVVGYTMTCQQASELVKKEVTG
jgi:hypothetical protein